MQASRAIQDHFKDWDPAWVDHVYVDGVNLRMQLTKDKEQAIQWPRSIHFGPKYYDWLRDRFCLEGAGKKQLPAGDRPGEELFAAFKQALKHPVCRQPARDWCDMAAEVSKADALCLGQLLLKLSATASRDQLRTMISIGNCFHRHGTMNTFMEELLPLRSVFDRALLQVWPIDHRFCRKWSAQKIKTKKKFCGLRTFGVHLGELANARLGVLVGHSPRRGLSWRGCVSAGHWTHHPRSSRSMQLQVSSRLRCSRVIHGRTSSFHMRLHSGFLALINSRVSPQWRKRCSVVWSLRCLVPSCLAPLGVA